MDLSELGIGNLVLKGPQSKYFRFHVPVVLATTAQLSYCSMKAARQHAKEWMWLCFNKIFFIGPQYNFRPSI